MKGSNALAICYAPALLANPSQFAVFATVRRTILARCRQLQSVSLDLSDDSDNEEIPPSTNITKLSKVIFISVCMFLFNNSMPIVQAVPLRGMNYIY